MTPYTKLACEELHFDILKPLSIIEVDPESDIELWTNSYQTKGENVIMPKTYRDTERVVLARFATWNMSVTLGPIS